MRRALATLSFMALLASPARAFDFIEHAHFTARALGFLVAENDAYRAVLESAEVLLDSELLCRGKALFMEGPENCLSLSDVTGLTGDHAGSPPLVMWRWFDDFARSREQRLRIFEVLAQTGAWVESPDEAAFRIPARARFLTYMRKFAPRYWPTARPDDASLLTLDDSYMSVILRMPSHFRAPIEKSFDDELPALAAQRHLGKPANHAFAWYADLHLGALTFAALSRTDVGRADPRYRATAVVLELAALHYLQDAVAPGHITANAALGPASTSLTHDRDNAEGMLVAVPRGLCEGLGKPPGMLAVSPLCTPRDGLNPKDKTFEHVDCPEVKGLAPGDCRPMSFDALTDPQGDKDARRVVIYGDGVVASQGRIYGVPYELARATDDWATALSYMSLREVVLEATRTGACEGWPCDWQVPAAAKIRKHEGFKTLMDERLKPDRSGAPDASANDDGKRYELMVAWWELVSDRAKARRDRILAGFREGSFAALRLVPQLAAGNREYQPIEVLSGHTVTVRFGWLHAFEGRHTRFPETWSQPIPETRLAYRVVAPRLPVILELGFDVATLRGDAHEGTATHLLFGVGWHFGIAYAQAGLAFGWMWPDADFSGRWDIELGLNLVDKSAAGLSLAWLVEGGDEYGIATGFGLRGSIGMSGE